MPKECLNGYGNKGKGYTFLISDGFEGLEWLMGKLMNKFKWLKE